MRKKWMAILLALLCAVPAMALARPLSEYGLSKLVSLAEGGDAAAQAALGDRYLLANGGVEAVDEAAALRWYQAAVEQGDGNGQARLGWMYEQGLAVSADPAKAYELYTLAAAQKIGLAQGRLGWLAETDALAEAVPAAEAGDEAALAWYRLGAANGDALSQRQLGIFYEQGRAGLEAAPREAAAWYQKASKQGDIVATACLGWCYEAGVGQSQDLKSAARYYQQAAAGGSAFAMRRLGWFYEQGGKLKKTKLDQDYAAAFDWYCKGAALGDAVCLCSLGRMYDTGMWPDVDAELAHSYYLQAAELGYPYAMYCVGWNLLNGRGVAEDAAEAREWLQKAADGGVEAAAELLAAQDEASGDGAAPQADAE